VTRLRDLQLRFQDYLLGVSEDIEQDIVSTANALAEHRLGTYYNAYRIRLIDCLAVDFSALEKYLGREAFEQMALEYLRHYPSTHPSVRWFGQNLPRFLAEHHGSDDAELLQELARYEWAQTMVFDATDNPQLVRLDDMAQVPAEAWPGLRFKFIQARQQLDLSWNIPPLEHALDTNEELPRKQRSEVPLRWLLWRRNMNINWRSLEVHEAWAMDQAVSGTNFADICEGLLEWIDAEQVGLVAAGFLKQWINDELLVRLDH
jgi:hypothetical protein